LYVVFKYLNEYKYNVFVFLVYVVEEPCGCDGSEDDLDERWMMCKRGTVANVFTKTGLQWWSP
jgi:hypothetical protein